MAWILASSAVHCKLSAYAGEAVTVYFDPVEADDAEDVDAGRCAGGGVSNAAAAAASDNRQARRHISIEREQRGPAATELGFMKFGRHVVDATFGVSKSTPLCNEHVTSQSKHGCVATDMRHVSAGMHWMWMCMCVGWVRNNSQTA